MSETTESVAVIGMAGRFPGARSVPEFWANLCAGRETISRFTPEQLEPGSREDMASRADPHYVPARGILHDVDRF
ncbi:MAG TPA: beta-ketoacyl synthase N-terminal-like domain-containing protein, partial [Burkholderiales bacterium]|nr:beta-ketoacyl synthase N-terminal-like domain-containing protein [Burkholderiales bacterium]